MCIFCQDQVDIYRTEDTRKTGSFITKQQEVIKASHVQCHYSQRNKKIPTEDGAARTVSEHSLFCPLRTDIKEGDRLVITQRNGSVINATAGEIFPYTGKLQISVKRDDVI